MGVLGLWKLIDGSGKIVALDTLENKVLAIDISIWLHQVVKGFQDAKGNAVPNAHLLGLFNRLCKLKFYGIKPVFVFDGGAPTLKVDTIKKRHQNKNKIQLEADRIHNLLLSSLAKEKIVQQALAVANSSNILSPTKISPRKSRNDPYSDENLFALPETVVQNQSSEEELNSTIESECSQYDDQTEANYYKNLKAIDINSDHFKNLPSDVRYEILSELKETRKHASWGIIQDLPSKDNEFSTFQMDRLLKRRRIQQSLEEAESEIGGKCLSMDILENLLSEDGIDIDIDNYEGGQFASDENRRFLLVRDLNKKIQNSNKHKEMEKIENEITSTERLSDDEYDQEEINRAIQLSMTGTEKLVEQGQTIIDREFVETSVNDLQFTVEQKKALGSAASVIAKGFLMEYGGISSTDFKQLMENDNKKVTKLTPLEQAASTLVADDNSGVSSETDSDLVEVANGDFDSSDMDIFPIYSMAVGMPETTDKSKDFRLNDLNINVGNNIEIKVSDIKTSVVNIEEDIFADVFTVSSEAHVETRLAPKEYMKQKVEFFAGSKSRIETENSASKILRELEEERQAISKLDLDHIVLKEERTAKSDNIELDLKLKNLMEPNKEVSFDDAASDDTIINLDLPNVADDKPEVKEPIDVILHDQISNINESDLTANCGHKSVGKTTDIHIGQLIQHLQEETIVVLEDSQEIVKATTVNEEKPQILVNTKNSANMCDNSDTVHEINKLHDSVISSKSATEVDAVQTMCQILDKDKLDNMAAEHSRRINDLECEKNRQDRYGTNITQRMISECKELLKLFGIPFIVAPMEAEAQCAFLNHMKLTDGTITDDSDIWLFGGQTVYKNFFNLKKNVLEFRMENIEKLYSIDRKKMIQLAMFVGSDYTTGVHGIGAITALEILAAFPSTPTKTGETTEIMSILSSLRRFRDWYNNTSTNQNLDKKILRGKLKNIELIENFPSSAIAEAYIYPIIDESSEQFTWGHLNEDTIREYTKSKFGWTRLKTDEILLPVMNRLNQQKQQRSITNYFNLVCTPTEKNLKISKRMRTAINKLSGKMDDVANEDGPKKPKRAKKERKNIRVVEIEGIENDVEIVQSQHTLSTAVPENKEYEVLPTPSTSEIKSRKKPAPEETTNNITNPRANRKRNVSSVDLQSNKSSNVKTVGSKQTIPQREKEANEMEKNRINAIKIFKKTTK